MVVDLLHTLGNDFISKIKILFKKKVLGITYLQGWLSYTWGGGGGGGQRAPLKLFPPFREFCSPKILSKNNRKISITTEISPWKNFGRKPEGNKNT